MPVRRKPSETCLLFGSQAATSTFIIPTTYDKDRGPISKCFAISSWFLLVLTIVFSSRAADGNDCLQSFNVDSSKQITTVDWSLDGGDLVDSMSCEYASWLHTELLFSDSSVFTIEDYAVYDAYLSRIDDLEADVESATEELLEAIDDGVLKKALTETIEEINNAAFVLSAVVCFLEPSRVCVLAAALSSPGIALSLLQEDEEWTAHENELRLYLEQMNSSLLMERARLPKSYESAKARTTRTVNQLCQSIKSNCLPEE